MLGEIPHGNPFGCATCHCRQKSVSKLPALSLEHSLPIVKNHKEVHNQLSYNCIQLYELALFPGFLLSCVWNDQLLAIHVHKVPHIPFSGIIHICSYPNCPSFRNPRTCMHWGEAIHHFCSKATIV